MTWKGNAVEVRGIEDYNRVATCSACGCKDTLEVYKCDNCLETSTAHNFKCCGIIKSIEVCEECGLEVNK